MKAPAAKPAARSQFFTAKGGPWGKCFLPRAKGETRFWLVKSEPHVFSWDDLMKSRHRTTSWNGVRNFTARNFMRDGMKVGDRVFFYHSNAEPPGIVGICEVAREAHPDLTALDPKDYGYDPKASPENPIWMMVDLRAVEALPRLVTLPELKASKALRQMALIRTGRLSVIPVTETEWNAVHAMAAAAAK